MFLLVMSPLLCRTTLVQCQFLLPFIVRKAKTWGITSPAQPQMRATRFSPIPRRFHLHRRRVQLTRNGTIIPANNTVSLGAVRDFGGKSGINGKLRSYRRAGDCRECAIDYWRDFCLSIKNYSALLMLVPEALRYQTYKTCTLALCRPDKTRQRRIWHKQSALCWSVPLTLTLSPEGRGDWPGTF